MVSIVDKIIKIHQPRPKYTVINEIANRWSPRYYSQEKIPSKHLRTIFEAGRWAPSGHNQQPWHFYFTEKNSRAYKKLFFTLNDYNQSWAHTAPLLILACAITDTKEGRSPFAFYDLGAATLSLILQAQSMGYHARQMALFDKHKVQELFNLGKSIEPYVIIAMGKIGNYENAPKQVIEYELDPRPRKINLAEELKLP